jgi:hypothetical protein
MISRLAKGVLPPNTSIHKDALLAMSKSCTVFVNFLAAKYVFCFCYRLSSLFILQKP